MAINILKKNPKCWHRMMVSLLLVIGLLCSCSSKAPANTGSTSAQGNTLHDAILDELQADVVPGEDLPLSISYSNAIYTSISASILSQNDKKGQASVEFKYIDILTLADGYKGDIEDIDSFYEYCLETISAGRANTITEKAEVSYTVLVDGKAKIYVVEQIENEANILTGGAFTVLEEMLKGEG